TGGAGRSGIGADRVRVGGQTGGEVVGGGRWHEREGRHDDAGGIGSTSGNRAGVGGRHSDRGGGLLQPVRRSGFGKPGFGKPGFGKPGAGRGGRRTRGIERGAGRNGRGGGHGSGRVGAGSG